MTFTPGKSRTKVEPEGSRFQARYRDPEIKRWFDLGDPRDTEEEARLVIASMEHSPQGWFLRGTYPWCSCGYTPKDNGKLYAHWAEHGISWYHDTRAGQVKWRSTKEGQ